MAFPAHNAGRPDLYASKSYLASPSYVGSRPADGYSPYPITPNAPSYLQTPLPSSSIAPARQSVLPRRPLRKAEPVVSSAVPIGNRAAAIIRPDLQQVQLVGMPSIAIEEPMSEEQRDLFASPALRYRIDFECICKD